MPDPERDGLGAARGPKLGKDRGHVKLHRVARNPEMGGNGRIAHALRHSGRLWAADTSPRGATFHVILPTTVEAHE